MPNQATQNGPKVKIKPPLVFLTTLFFACVIHYFSKLQLSLSEITRIFWGILLISVSGIIQLHSLKVFKQNGRKPNPKIESTKLFISGPYKYTRNPMYLSLVLLQFGLGVIFNNLWISIFSFIALTIVHFFAVRPEEEYLKNKFGSDYKEYTEKVRRYI